MDISTLDSAIIFKFKYDIPSVVDSISPLTCDDLASSG